jgi:DNA repair exonuclease SbcCD ATPase subunit
MASESTEERNLSVSIPAELDEWLDKEAAEQGVDRDTLLIQLIASYRTTAQFDGALEGELDTVESTSLDEAVETAVEDKLEAEVDEQLPRAVDQQVKEQLPEDIGELIAQEVQSQINARLSEQLESQLSDQVPDIVESVVTDQISEATNSVQRNLDDRISGIEDDYKQKLEDVRERVIQVKKEADKKAPVDHTHDEFDQLPPLNDQVETIEADLAQLTDEYEATIPMHGEKIDEFDERLDQIEDRLQTVAWVVSDIRDTIESGGLEAVERIKRAAAKADIERANCENCGESVAISLMTDPECPHCDAAVTNIEPSGGWFGKPKLLVASQLESGE